MDLSTDCANVLLVEDEIGRATHHAKPSACVRGRTIVTWLAPPPIRIGTQPAGVGIRSETRLVPSPMSKDASGTSVKSASTSRAALDLQCPDHRTGEGNRTVRAVVAVPILDPDGPSGR